MEGEETINEMEVRQEEHWEAEEQKEKKISRNERMITELCDNSKWNNIHKIWVPEREERERDKGIESLFKEIIAENFPNLGKKIDTQTWKYRKPLTKGTPRKQQDM